jgi:hypothetical protein
MIARVVGGLPMFLSILAKCVACELNVIMLETPTLTTNATTLKSLDKFANSNI